LLLHKGLPIRTVLSCRLLIYRFDRGRLALGQKAHSNWRAPLNRSAWGVQYPATSYSGSACAVQHKKPCVQSAQSTRPKPLIVRSRRWPHRQVYQTPQSPQCRWGPPRVGDKVPAFWVDKCGARGRRALARPSGFGAVNGLCSG